MNFVSFLCFRFINFASGRYTGEETVFILSFSPLWTGAIWCRGDTQGRRLVVLSFSPLWTGFFEWDESCCFWCRGEYTGEEFLNSRSPSYEPNPVPVLRGSIFVHFNTFMKWGPRWVWWYIIGVADPTIYSIYSLRHFLTTKGALIDGDGYPPLPPLKWPQKWPKNDQFSLKFHLKKVSKTVILNGKIKFFMKITTIDIKKVKKWPKIDQHLWHENEIKFDYQKGDSGSALMLGEKCVIIEAPKLVTKNDQKWCQ